MATIRGEIDGLAEILGKLRHVRKQTTRSKILRRALDKATQPVARAAKSLAPRVTGQTKKAIGRRVKTYRTSGSVVVVVGVRRGFRKQVGVRVKGKSAGQPIFHDPAKVAHLVEEGHGGRSPAPPHPFLKPAWDQTRVQVRDTVTRLIRDGVEAEAKRGR